MNFQNFVYKLLNSPHKFHGEIGRAEGQLTENLIKSVKTLLVLKLVIPQLREQKY